MADGGSSAEQIEIELDLPPGQVADEDVLDRRRINTPSRQGATIPAGWKPTVHKPVPVMRCHHVWPDDHPRGGDRCNRWSLRGSQLCYIHSGRGNLKNVEEYRLAIVEAARLQLTEAVPDALATLFELAANSPADNVKLKAATEILDRAGLRTAAELNVQVEHIEAQPAATLSERLQKLKSAADVIRAKEEEAEAAAAEAELNARMLTAATAAVDLDDDGDDGGIIEGEIVEP